MANQWTMPPTGRQDYHEIPPTPEHLVEQNMPTYRRNDDPSFQNCYCMRCAAMRRAQAEPPNWYPVEQQDPRYSRSTGTPFPYRGQDVRDRTETAMIVPGHATWPQTARIPNNFDYDLAYEIAGPPNVDLIRAPMLDASIREDRRRLAGRYLNNPEAYVSTIRLEPGTSGRLQVVITVEMVNQL